MPPSPALEAAGEISAPAKRLLPWLVAVAFFMESLDSTILNTAVPAIAQALGIAPLSMKSALASYTLAAAVFIPVSGWVANRFGTRRVFASAIGIFTLGSLLCGIARDIHWLVAFRILQGCGGAMMLPVGRLTMVRAFPKSELIRAMSFVAIPGLVGPMVGPVIGGLIVSWFHWSVIFFVNIPIGLAGLWMVRRHLPNYSSERSAPLDVVGFVLFGAGIGLLSYVLEVFGEHSLSTLQMLGLLCLCALLLGAYWINARGNPHPLLQLRLFAIRTFRTAVGGSFLTRLGIGGMAFLLPLLYQVGFGFSAVRSGLLIMPQTVAAISLKLAMPRILKHFGYRRVLIVNTAVLGLIIVTMSLLTQGTPVALIVALVFAFGFVQSLQFTSMNTLAFADIDESEASAASTIASTLQLMSVGFSVATASLVVGLFIPDRFHADAATMIGGLHHAFLVLGAWTIASTAVFASLRRADGSSVSRHRAAAG